MYTAVVEESASLTSAPDCDFNDDHWLEIEREFASEDEEFEHLAEICEKETDLEKKLDLVDASESFLPSELLLGHSLEDMDDDYKKLLSVFEYQDVVATTRVRESHQNNYFTTLAQRTINGMSRIDMENFASRKYIRKEDETYCTVMKCLGLTPVACDKNSTSSEDEDV